MKFRLNPCGMIMDILRKGYETRFQPFYDSDKAYTIRWYPAPLGAQIFPGHHIYASGVYSWTANIPYQGPGEVYLAPKKFVSWLNPPPYKGQCWCGEYDWFIHGCSVKILDTPQPAVADCCMGPAVPRPLHIGGVATPILRSRPGR